MSYTKMTRKTANAIIITTLIDSIRRISRPTYSYTKGLFLGSGTLVEVTLWVCARGGL